MIVFDELLALPGFHAQSVRVFEIATPLHNLNAAHPGQLRNAASKPGQNGFLPGPQLGHIDARLGEQDTAAFGFARRGDGVGRVQQRLRGDAPLVQADAAQARVALDQDDFLAEVRRIKGRSIPAGPRADHYDFSFDWFHGKKVE